ncbi:TonB-dependent receptor domain-containing protein [Piscinibacter sakaiensis]|uniref:TonB-dependent receptor domain-containing protein n=1 Tax=Piscinibacter sakaiensis TaxID=1547922 RepID=UPI003AB06782
MLFKRKKICTGLLIAFGGTGVLAPSVSFAQSAQPEALNRVEITGSLIRRLASETATPVITLNVEELQKAGVTNAEQAVRFITQNQGGTVTSGSVSGTNGAAAYADLRSLGAQRTLVLLNGKRIAPNPFSTVATDLNTLPMAAIARIETLPDGASSIYGTDAIAGVINFITHRNYRGGSIDASAQVTEAGGGNVYSGNLLGGIGDLNKQGWNIMGALNVRQSKPLGGTERDFAATSYQPWNGFNALSPTAFPANYSQGTVSGNPTAPNCDPPGSISVPEVSGANAGRSIRCFADTQTFTNTLPKQDQQSVFLRGALALGSDHTASLEYFRSMNNVETKIAPSPEGGLTMTPLSPYYPGRGITPANPALNPAQNLSISWRTTALGSRSGEQENTTQRLLAGLEGVVAGWDYQANLFASSAKVDNFFLNGYPMTQPLRNGVSGCAVPLVSNVCPAGQQLMFNGAPLYLNPFGAQTANGLAYLQANQVLGQVQDGEAKMSGATANFSRVIGKLPGGSMALALAAEVRKEEMIYNTNIPKVSQAASSGLAGSGALRQGDRDISALAMELSMPVVKGLELGFSLRGDKYSDFGETINPKLSVRYQPNDKILLRGSANTGFTAPTLTQLYAPNSTTFTSTRYNDPVLCPNGVPAANAVPSRDCGIQFQQLQGGNAQLTAEESKAWTLGFVVQPTREFSVGLDYWHYYIKDSISVIGEQSIFADPAKYAALFVRCSQAPAARQTAIGACQIPGGDPLAYVINTNLNLGDVRTNGIDIQMNWEGAATPWGKFNASVRGSYVLKYEFQVEPNGRWFNPNGNYNAQFGGPVIRYQQVTTIGWQKGDWSSQLTNRFVNGYRDQNAQGAPFNVAPFNTNKVGDYSIFDIAVTYRGVKNLTLSAGVLNLFDTNPPFTNQVSRFQSRAYDDRFHNPLGRTYRVAAKYEF